MSNYDKEFGRGRMTLSTLCTKLGVSRTNAFRLKISKSTLLDIHHALENEHTSLRFKKDFVYNTVDEDFGDLVWEHYIKETYERDDEEVEDFEQLTADEIDELLGYGR
jgi:hypothetical protein